ncbi:MAG: prepilin-type N-terminal cleavage/methylation domain-containing protein [Candidatus Sumerlaeaceae bacterium]
MRKRAFTLIELLIVVAIIAILAAIAVPNFLEAQTRAKVSRVKADMRSLSTAIESYAVDANKYPFHNSPVDEDFPNYDRSAPGSMKEGRFERRVPVNLTTPIAYMSSLLNDPFPNLKGEEGKGGHPYHYANDQDFISDPAATPGLDQYPVAALFTIVAVSNDTPPAFYTTASALYCMVSHGPDVDHDNPDDDASARTYDATNGTSSSGDIYYFGPGLGFR